MGIEAEYKPKKDGKKCVTSLDQYFTMKNVEFNEIENAKFNNMMLSTVEFDKDHVIYILMPKDCFKEI